MRRVEVDFDYVAEQAREIASRRYTEPPPIPEVLRNLEYDDYQKIRFNNNSYIWKDEGLPFAAGFFHLGYLYRDSMDIHEFTPTHEQRIRYLPTFFEFDDKDLQNSLPSSLGYAGFRVSTNMPGGENYWEVASFLGASYFRAVGLGQRYGASARGIAVNAGLSQEEEFPRFTKIWMGKPLGNAKELVIYALLEGKSLAGAYRFVLKPGEATAMDVKARIFMRESVQSFGIAPLTSMYWRGENRRSPETDYRPEVHDSDGLIIKERDNDPVWRPFDLADKTRLSYFSVDAFQGFGVMQRDREFANYQDMEAHYHKRPSVWVVAKNDWGPGFVRLVELPTDSEFDDNIVAFWEPVVLPEKGDRLDYEYTLHWNANQVPANYPEAYVLATRIGEDLSYPGTHLFVVDFRVPDSLGPEPPKEETPEEGESNEEEEETEEQEEAEKKPRKPPEALITVSGPSTLQDYQISWNGYANAWRVTMRVDSAEPGGEAVELRCQLEFEGEEKKLSEVWSYQWTR